MPRRKFFSEKCLNFAREIFHISPLPFPNYKGSERNVSNMQIKAIDASISTMGFGFSLDILSLLFRRRIIVEKIIRHIINNAVLLENRV